ncbi:MAG: hypothetical protein AB9866_01455 [Syntrophobacteraceae bacterium]
MKETVWLARGAAVEDGATMLERKEISSPVKPPPGFPGGGLTLNRVFLEGAAWISPGSLHNSREMVASSRLFASRGCS